MAVVFLCLETIAQERIVAMSQGVAMPLVFKSRE
jgi:hypothetical protein